MSTILDICSRCKVEKRRVLNRFERQGLPEGWTQYDFNDLGPDPSNQFELCPPCTKNWEERKQIAFREYCTEAS